MKRRRTRNHALRRVLRLAMLLRNGRDWTHAELAHDLHCTTRTIMRDLNVLEELHAPLERKPTGVRMIGPIPIIEEVAA